MSHIVRAKITMADHQLLDQSVKELGLNSLGVGEHKMYGGQRATGYAFNLPGWSYPVVVDAKGEINFDNFGGSWGDQTELDKVCQRYSLNAVQSELVSGGYQVSVATEDNGDLVVTGSQFATA